jgi:hypothetical protein
MAMIERAARTSALVIIYRFELICGRLLTGNAICCPLVASKSPADEPAPSVSLSSLISKEMLRRGLVCDAGWRGRALEANNQAPLFVAVC